MLQIAQAASELFARGEPAALATVVRTSGSAPAVAIAAEFVALRHGRSAPHLRITSSEGTAAEGERAEVES
jgi:xanthine/CO dehydrogenase XdhC/CoxF family maturation factor